MSSIKKQAIKQPLLVKKNAFSTNLQAQVFILIGIAIVLYLNTINHGFVLDDQAVVSQNRFVQQGFGGWKDILSTFYWKGYCNQNSGLFRPLSLLFFSVEWQLLPDNPFIHHLLNIVLYGILIWVLFKFLYKLLGKEYPLVPFVALLLFATHPMHTEVVANIKSRDEILSLLFFTASTTLLLHYLERPSLILKLGSLVLFFLALLSKEASILFLPVLFCLLWLVRKQDLNTCLKLLIPYIAVTTLWGIWYYLVIHLASDSLVAYTYHDNSLVAIHSLVNRLCTSIGMVGQYIFLCFIPTSFLYDYSYNQIPELNLLSFEFIISLVAIIVCIYGVYRTYKTQPLIAFSILFFFITLSLSSNFIKLIGTTFANRALFTPSLGFCLFIAFVLNQFLNKNNKSTILLIVTSVITLWYAQITFQRNKDWKSNYTLFKADANSNSSRTHYNYASILLNEAIPFETDATRKNQLYLEIMTELTKAVTIDTGYTEAYINLGVTQFKLKNYNASIVATKKALELSPKDISIYSNLGDAFFMVGQYDSSIVCFQKCITANYIQKDTYNFIGTAWFNKKDYEKAANYFKKGLEKDSTYAGLWINYGNALAAGQHFADALIAFDKLYQLDPQNKQALYFKALTYHNMGDKINAQKFYQLSQEK